MQYTIRIPLRATIILDFFVTFHWDINMEAWNYQLQGKPGKTIFLHTKNRDPSSNIWAVFKCIKVKHTDGIQYIIYWIEIKFVLRTGQSTIVL